MTENEIIKELESCYKTMSVYIGSSEECRKHNEAISKAIDAVKEIQQYRSIGTVEECREAVECRKTKRMTNKVRCMTITDAEKYPNISGSCPKCGRRSYEGKIRSKYCPWCGQTISWEESED